jgi:hypothetical protein
LASVWFCHLARGEAVFPRKAKVDHDALFLATGAGAHGEVGGLEVAVEVAELVDGLNGLDDLDAQADGGGEAEATAWAAPAQLGEILAKKLHDEIVMILEVAAVDVAADKMAVLHLLEHRHLHFQNCFLCVPSFKLNCDGGVGVQVYSTENLSECPLPYFPGKSPSPSQDSPNITKYCGRSAHFIICFQCSLNLISKRIINIRREINLKYNEQDSVASISRNLDINGLL